jgi:hypothetical protein
MGRQQQGMGRDFDLLSQPMQQQLQARVAERNNNVAAVQEEVEAQLAELDRHGEPRDRTERRHYQAQRALRDCQIECVSGVPLDIRRRTDLRTEWPTGSRYRPSCGPALSISW